jgi:hypothetical protein
MDTRNAIQRRASEKDPAPALLWHLTSFDNAYEITRNGFSAVWGNYFSEEIGNAAKFLAIRGIFEAMALQVKTRGLNFVRSGDHDPTFFGTDDSWVCFDSIPASAIVDIQEVEFG